MYLEILKHLSAHPYEQALCLLILTFILEDVAIVTAGVIIAEGSGVSFKLAFVTLVIGVVLGDLSLYLLGRSTFARWGISRIISVKRREVIAHSLKKNVIKVLVIARCVPGLRLPVFFAAGLSAIRISTFFSVTIVSGLLWVAGVLSLAVRFQEYATVYLGNLRFVLLFFLVVTWFLARGMIKLRT